MISLLRSHDAHRLVTPGEGSRDALLIAVCAFTVSVAAAGRPSFWMDEAATVSASTRPLPELRDLLGSIDAVHALYYLVMHAWFLVFPATEFWARVPSALMIGVAAGGVVLLGRQLSTRAVAATAGVVFAVLPRTTWAGIEARSYAMSMAAAVWLTVLCVTATQRPGRRWWTGYALALVGATLVNPFLILLVAAHGLLVLRLGAGRRTTVGWAAAVAAATVAVAPFLAFIRTERSQVGWIWPVGPNTAVQILGDQNFPPVFSSSQRLSDPTRHLEVTPEILRSMLLAWAIVLPVVVAVVAVAIAAYRHHHGATPVVGPNARLAVLVAAAWIVVPTVVLVAYSMVGEPLYQPHYLAFTTPAVALLIGLGVVTMAREPGRVALVTILIVAAAAPNYLAQRTPYAKHGMDYSQVADLLAAHAGRGDCLHGGMSTVQGVAWIKAARPDAFRTLRDDGEARPAVSADSLTGSRRGLDAWADRLATCPAVWTVADADAALPALPELRLLRDRGFRVIHTWRFNLTQVIESRR